MAIDKSPQLCCTPVLHARLVRADAEALATAFRAIADPGRLRLLSFLTAQPGQEACACHLRKPLGLSQPTVSHHLKVLFEAERMAALRDALAPPDEADAKPPARPRARARA